MQPPERHGRFNLKRLKAAPRPMARAHSFALGPIACLSYEAGGQAMPWMTGYRQNARSFTHRRLPRTVASPAVVNPGKQITLMNGANSTRINSELYETENDISQQ